MAYMLCLLLLQIAFAVSVMKNYKAMLQQVKDNGVTSEEAFNLAVKLSSEDRYVYFVKPIVQESINFGWVDMYMYIYILHLDVFLQKDASSSEGFAHIAGSLCCCIYHVFEKTNIHKNIDQNGNILKMKNI